MTNKPGTKSAEQLQRESREREALRHLYSANMPKSMAIAVLVVAAVAALIVFFSYGFIPGLIVLASGVSVAMFLFVVSELVERQNAILMMLIDLKLK